MGLIPTLITFAPNTLIKSADVNSDFAAIVSAFNNTAVLTDTARTITVTDIFTASQTFSGGIAVTGGNLTITGVGGSLGIQIASPTNYLDIRTGQAGAWGSYALIASSSVTADQGGLLLSNSVAGTVGNSAMKFSSTFNASGSRRFRMGWVDESATETWLSNSNVASIEIRPFGTIGFLSVAQDSMVLNIQGTQTGLTGVSQRGFTLDFQSNSGSTTDSTALVLRTGTAASAYTTGVAYALHIFDAVLGAGSTITAQEGIRIDDQTKGTTATGIRINQGVLMRSILVNQQSGVTLEGLNISSGTQTGSTATNIVTLSQTWNTTGAPVGLSCNIINTASAGSARVFDFLINSTTALKLTIGGVLVLTQTATQQADGFDITGGTVTGSASPNVISIAQTWNTTGTPTGLRIAVTNTASANGAALVIINSGAAGGTNVYRQNPNGDVVISAIAASGANTLTLNGVASATALQVNPDPAGLGITITQGAGVSNSAFQIQSGSVTGSGSTTFISFAQTWNTTGGPTGLTLAITNTASGASARLINILSGAAGSTSQFAITTNGLVLVRNSIVEGVVALTYSASITPAGEDAAFYTLTVTNGTAFTINAPTNLIAGWAITFDILNSSGGAMGAVTFAAAYKLAGGAFTAPASTKRRTISFYSPDGSTLIETGRASADI